jgi:hypothetical protein
MFNCVKLTLYGYKYEIVYTSMTKHSIYSLKIYSTNHSLKYENFVTWIHKCLRFAQKLEDICTIYKVFLA